LLVEFASFGGPATALHQLSVMYQSSETSWSSNIVSTGTFASKRRTACSPCLNSSTAARCWLKPDRLGAVGDGA
jgi:hypothetical protein